MSKLIDLTNMKFGRLTVIARAENKHGKARWLCRCDCGNEIIAYGSILLKGNTRSCSCLQKEITSKRCFKSLINQKFGLLTVLERVANNKHNRICYKCRCECGREVVVESGHLKSGNTASCGCLHGQHHGMENTKIYKTWSNIKTRCTNSKVKCYARYGGRGITFYKMWAESFVEFYNYVSQLPHFGEKGYSLDRIDNNGNYEPGNLRWATAKQQGRNTRTNTIIECQGESMTLIEWAEKSKIPPNVLSARYCAGDRDEYLFRPVRKHGELTANEVKHIRELYSTGNYSQYKLAKMFNVSQSNVCNIVKFKYWNNVSD